MSKLPEQTTLRDPDLNDGLSNGSPLPSPWLPPTGSNGASSNGTSPRAVPTQSTRRDLRWFWAAGFAVLLIGAGAAAYFFTQTEGARADVLTHKVTREPLRVTVTEKGTFESAENRDIVCKVRAGNKGFASTINEVVPDGTRVKPGDVLMILDDSALKDQEVDQQIKIEQAEAAKVKAETDLKIAREKTDGAVELARAAVENAQIELDKYTGLSFDPTRTTFAAVGGIPVALTELGAFRQELDNQNGQISLAQANVEQNRERSDWAQRMVKLAYMSPAQAQAEKSRLDSSMEDLRSKQAKRNQLLNYDRRQQLTDLQSKLNAAIRLLRQTELEKIAMTEQASSELKAKIAILKKEQEKLSDPVDGILQQRKWCRITAPLDIKPDSMVVYFKNENNRYQSNSQGMIEQGAQVKESQKMLRIPNLDKMQVSTKIHEAMVSRIRLGQRAMVKVDALPDKQFVGVVKWKAPVASQNDFWSSDIKLYQTIVRIEGELGPDGQIIPLAGEILSPDMTAEVTIGVDAAPGPVLTVPAQSLLGGAEMGETREVFVKIGNIYERKTITLGLYNEKMVEIRSGLNEGDEVVLNPKVLLGDKDKTKTREAGDLKGGDGKNGEGKNGEKYPSDSKSPNDPAAGTPGLGEPTKKGGGGKKGAGGAGAKGGGGGPPSG